MLGPFTAVATDGLPTLRPGRKSIALMACLAVEPDTVWTRDRLARLLWDRRPIEQARTSLRQEMVRLRQALGRNRILADLVGGRLRLRTEDLDIDVVQFRSALTQPRRSADAAMLYRGDLLEGIESDRDLECFGDWLTMHRRQLKTAAVQCYVQLLRESIARSDAPEATRLAERTLTIEPDCEEAHQWLIRAHGARHDLHGVIEQFRSCREALRARHQMEPSPETCRLVELFKVTLRTGPPLNAASRYPQGTDRKARGRKRTMSSSQHVDSLGFVDDRRTIAVLPFIDLSAGDRDETLVDGLTDETIAALTQVQGISVTARSSVMVYKGAAMDVRQITTELGVRYALEASIRRDRMQFRVNMRLIDGKTGLHLWAESVERPLSELMSVRDSFITKSVLRLQQWFQHAELDKHCGTPECS